MLPDERAARPMFLALFGELALHQRPEGLAELSQNAFSLFYARSAALGWLAPAVEGASGGLWGMNDADAIPASGPQPQRVAWFQVVVTHLMRGGLLPVQPFLSCAGDVVARLGTLRLAQVHVLLPERDPPVAGRPASAEGLEAAEPLLDGLHWFGDCDPKLRTSVRITMDGWRDPSIRAAAPALVHSVREITQDVFTCDSFSLDEDDHVVPQPDPFVFQPGRVHHRVTFHGTLAEWSLDAVGWLAAFLSDQSSRQGISTPLMITAATGTPD
jgi:hypothetical protein